MALFSSGKRYSSICKQRPVSSSTGCSMLTLNGRTLPVIEMSGPGRERIMIQFDSIAEAEHLIAQLQRQIALLQTRTATVGAQRDNVSPLDRLSTLKQALGTLPEEVTLDQITEQPTIGAKWNTGMLPRIGGIIHCHVHYSANGRGTDVKPGTPGLVVGYFAERGWLYCITQFPGKAVLVAAVDIIQSAATVAP